MVDLTDFVKLGLGGRGDARKCSDIPTYCSDLHHPAETRREKRDGGEGTASLAVTRILGVGTGSEAGMIATGMPSTVGILDMAMESDEESEFDGGVWNLECWEFEEHFPDREVQQVQGKQLRQPNMAQQERDGMSSS